jgi:hypothetical protein
MYREKPIQINGLSIHLKELIKLLIEIKEAANKLAKMLYGSAGAFNPI